MASWDLTRAGRVVSHTSGLLLLKLPISRNFHGYSGPDQVSHARRSAPYFLIVLSRFRVALSVGNSLFDFPLTVGELISVVAYILQSNSTLDSGSPSPSLPFMS